MTFFQRLKDALTQYFYAKRIGKARPRHEFVSLQHAKKVGILIHIHFFNLRYAKQITDFITRLEKEGKQVIIIELNTRNTADSVFGDQKLCVFLTKKYFNWLKIPDHYATSRINKHHLDVLIDLDISEEPYARFLSGLSNAKTRVGIYREGLDEYYDLMVSMDPNLLPQELLHNIEHFLNLLKK